MSKGGEGSNRKIVIKSKKENEETIWGTDVFEDKS